MSNEIEWRDIPGYEGLYQVSNTGLIRVTKTLMIMRQHLSKQGYPSIGLTANSKKLTLKVHLLVMLAFVGERPTGLVTNHKNGIRTDANLSNLEYVTMKENNLHAYRVLGRISPIGKRNQELSIGEMNPSAKLNKESVQDIRRLYSAGVSQGKLAKKFGVTQATIYRLVHRHTWKHVE